ncbi:MAG: hypothetical protein ACP5NP_11845 [Acetobacteraceae bacterium]
MSYRSVDSLQRVLSDEVFNYAEDRKKAAGRALGTLVELITFYTLCAWDLRNHVIIERSIPEFANPSISHNVEFSLHPLRRTQDIRLDAVRGPVSNSKIGRILSEPGLTVRPGQLVTTDRVIRNACILGESGNEILVTNVDVLSENRCDLTLCRLLDHPFAIVECKRVGVEEGMKKGPQTIEKAKQGAYVARSVSSLQKVRMRNGRYQGILEGPDGALRMEPYSSLLRDIIDGKDPALLRDFILTVGVVSNHGNWFTSDNQNKELRVLAQSYDWLLFLTDSGLSWFVERLLLHPPPDLLPARAAFLASYAGKSGANRFTKVRIDADADQALRRYFTLHGAEIEGWFSVIAPKSNDVTALRHDLLTLAGKNWKGIS